MWASAFTGAVAALSPTARRAPTHSRTYGGRREEKHTEFCDPRTRSQTAAAAVENVVAQVHDGVGHRDGQANPSIRADGLSAEVDDCVANTVSLMDRGTTTARRVGRGMYPAGIDLLHVCSQPPAQLGSLLQPWQVLGVVDNLLPQLVIKQREHEASRRAAWTAHCLGQLTGVCHGVHALKAHHHWADTVHYPRAVLKPACESVVELVAVAVV
jgi:hypothetical protein